MTTTSNDSDDPQRLMLLLPSATYRSDFIDAAESLGVEVVVASNAPQAMAVEMGDRAIVIDFSDLPSSVAAIAALHADSPIHAVVAVDEQGVALAAAASARLGFAHNPIAAVEATRDKLHLREALRTGAVSQPDFAAYLPDASPDSAFDCVEQVGGFPVVVKPLHLSGSQGVIRVDSAEALGDVIARVRSIACAPNDPVLIERYVSGHEVAVEGLLRDGMLDVLAVFDKPDPLVGPYFEESIYVTPSRVPAATLERVTSLIAEAVRALGLVEGPIHAEVRIESPPGESTSKGDSSTRLWMIEVAARSIGGLCARTLRFGLGITLEQIILRHALAMTLPNLKRERSASGVIMLPIGHGGILERVDGLDEARDLPGVRGLEITVPSGTRVEPLPEGDRYLGFVFANGESPTAVEQSLRLAGASIRPVWRTVAL